MFVLIHVQWKIFIDGRLQDTFEISNHPDTSTQDSEALTHEFDRLQDICHIGNLNDEAPSILIQRLQLSKITNESVLTDCTVHLSEDLYYSALDKKFKDDTFCRDQYTIIYVNDTADYLGIEKLCQKVQGTILTEEDTEIYHRKIDNLNSDCDTDGILTWLKTDKKLDFDSWCYVFTVNNTVEIRPCHRPLKCNLCKIKAGLQVTLFGQLDEFDKYYTVRNTYEGELYLKGHKTSIIYEFNDNWILRSSLVEFRCYNNDSVIPFVRMNWHCGTEEKLLAFSTCTLDEFACDDGSCVPETEKCNGVSDCADHSDERICYQVRKDAGYDTDQFPPLPDGDKTLIFHYKFRVYSIADVKTSDFYADVDIGLEFEWHDRRLELWDPPEKEEKIDCEKIWYPKLMAIDSSENGFLVALPDNFSERCHVKVADLESLKKMLTDPYMGKYIFYECESSLQ